MASIQCVGEVEHVKVGIIGYTGKFTIHVIFLMDSHAECNLRSRVTNGNHKHAGILGPDSRMIQIAIGTGNMKGIIGNGDNSGSITHGMQRTIGIHGNDRGRGYTIDIGHKVVVVGFEEVVAGGRVDSLPVTQREHVITLSDSEFEMFLGVDVKEQVCHITAAVGVDVVINPQRTFGSEVCLRHFNRTDATRIEDTSLCKRTRA